MEMSTNAVIRVSPLNTPVMHPTQVRIHHFFVPNRLIWDKWEDFITGGDGTGDIPVPPTVLSTVASKDLQDYMGVPRRAGVAISALPMRAYNLIYNEYYRDQDLCALRTEDDQTVASIAWEKDYFTEARPFTQKGPEISLPIGDAAPVISDGSARGPSFATQQNGFGTTHKLLGDTAGNNGVVHVNPGTASNDSRLFWAAEGSSDGTGLAADLSNATGATVNEFRTALAIQRYQEARSRYGSRYSEYLRYLGVTPADARLQRPEMLGGGTTKINFSEVLQTSPEASGETRYGVGDMWGHGIAGVRGNKFRKFFEEHGHIITMMSVRPKSTYQEGINRSWLRTIKEDYYQKELAHIGQQTVTKNEVYMNTTDGNSVFGYTDRYSEYRRRPSEVTGDFRNLLNMWHLGRVLPANVALNSDFIECKPSKRIYQASENDGLWVMANHHVVARRLVSRNSAGKII